MSRAATALAPRPSRHWDLPALLTGADPGATRPERHLWLASWAAWLRQSAPRAPDGSTAPADAADAEEPSTPWPVRRLRHFVALLERHPEHRERVAGLLSRVIADGDLVALLADFGFSSRSSLLGEWRRRLLRRLLPASPDTPDLGELFALWLPHRGDADWLRAIDSSTFDRLVALVPADWQTPARESVTYLVSAVRAAAFSAPLRQRMSAELLADAPFTQLAPAAERWGRAVGEGDAAAAAREASLLLALLGRCRTAALSVYDHLEAHGVSVDLVFDVDQLCRRIERVEKVMACTMARLGGVSAAGPVTDLLADLVRIGVERRSPSRLLDEHFGLLARKVAERSAETGEHYITRTRAEYLGMLRAAAGGGAVLGVTTFAKFGIVALGLSAFWGGFWAGVNYAASFLVVMLLHFTVATKQPAMTAPAMAARLVDVRTDAGLERFVDEVAHLIRSQMAGILGNLAAVIPAVLLAQALAWWWLGEPLIGEAKAEHVLHSLTLLGPTAFHAAFTGVLLFASSLIAGWAENAFVWHRLDSAIAWNPRVVVTLGATRAARWAAWWRQNVSGVAANLSLGLMLGLAPALAGFVGLPLDVRHVTLSTGQLAAAAGTLGAEVLRDSAFWWCVAGVAVTGALNVGISFALALRVAIRSRGIRVGERGRLYRAIGRRLWSDPLDFLWPPPGGHGQPPARA